MVLAAVSPRRATLSRLLDYPLAVLGTGAIDFAAFRWHVLGWLVLGISLWTWNVILADDEPSSGRA